MLNLGGTRDSVISLVYGISQDVKKTTKQNQQKTNEPNL